MSNNAYQSFFEHGGFFKIHDSLYEVIGEKAATLLHGQLTNDIKGLKDNEANYNLLLTQKGRIVGDCFAYKLADKIILALNPLFEEKIISHLKMLAPLSKVEIMPLKELKIIHVCAPSPFPSPIKGEGTPLPFVGGGQGEGSFIVNRIGFSGHDLFVPSDQSVPFDKLDEALIEVLRIEQGIPKIGVDVTEDNLPQEGGLEKRAISFTKGCYLGQEIVARLEYRGHVNKILVGLKLDTPSPLVGEGRGEGKITSQIFSPKLGAPLALGYVPYASEDPRIVKLPLNE